MIDFSNMLGKPLLHSYVPADQASITFVFQDGMRRSFGAVNAGGTRVSITKGSTVPVESALVFSHVTYPLDSNDGVDFFISQAAGIQVRFPAGSTLIELPE